jgi:hypothetical protein
VELLFLLLHIILVSSSKLWHNPLNFLGYIFSGIDPDFVLPHLLSVPLKHCLTVEIIDNFDHFSLHFLVKCSIIEEHGVIAAGRHT